MNLQHNIQPRSSINGFGRRRVDRETGPKPELKMHPGKLASGNFGTSGSAVNPSRDRLIYVMTSLIGLPVEVHVRNGSIISGIFHATNAENDFGIVLKMAQVIKDGSVRGQKPVPDTVKKPRDIFIQSKDLVQVLAKDVPLSIEEFSNGDVHEKRKDLMIDSAISHSHHLELERELERWTPDVDDPGCPELENIFDGTWNRNWDQFETNEALFGVKSTFNEEIYTTKLQRGPNMRELELQASRIAREIEGEDTHDLHLAEERGIQFNEDFDLDEEVKYSAVNREINDSRFEGNENSFLDAYNTETFGSSHASATPLSYSDVTRNKYGNVGCTSSTGLSMDEESPSVVHTEGDVKPLASDCVAKNSVFIKNESRLDDKLLHDQYEDKDVLSFPIEMTLHEEAQASKFIEVQTSTVAKQQSVDIDVYTDAYDSSYSALESKGSVGRSSEAAVGADFSTANEPIIASHSGVPKPSTSEHIGASSASSAPGLSPSSSLGSLSSDKSTLNPNAKEFKLNPNAKSFMPSASFRPSVPMSEAPLYFAGNLSSVPPMHNVPMGIGIGPSFAGPQPVYNPQAAQPQAYVHPGGPLYGQQMILGQHRPVYYMQPYPPEMQYKGRNF